MENRKPGNRVEARCSHVEVVADADDIRIGIISMNDRVPVSTVAVVRRPNLRDERRLRRNLAAEDTEKEKKCRCIDLQIFVDVPFGVFRVFRVIGGNSSFVSLRVSSWFQEHYKSGTTNSHEETRRTNQGNRSKTLATSFSRREISRRRMSPRLLRGAELFAFRADAGASPVWPVQDRVRGSRDRCCDAARRNL